ncbi:MAG TPA: beta-propeller fold lactonase family protein [Candidatus Acidoferrum sp.]|nr:beta-propeller fold lactonase family protein [Candidatus Acidoferrum sp.]
MQTSIFLRRASLIAALAVATIFGTRGAYAQTVLPTGATITPNAARGSVFQRLTVALPGFPNYTPDGAETTAISPDGKTLLILTSGYNFNLDSNGNYDAQASGEFVFVYDISHPRSPVETQVVFLQNERAFDGIVWNPNGSAFYVVGGADDVVYTFTPTGGKWAQSGTPINLNHTGDLLEKETEVGPTAALVGITADGTTLFVANHETDSVTSVDLAKGAVLQEFDLRPGIINPAQTGVPGGEFPYGIAVKGNSTVYVSSVRDREIDVLNFSNGLLTLTTRIPVAGNPGKMILNRAQSKLFVVANNSDELIVIDTATNEVVHHVNTSAPERPFGWEKHFPKGSNPNSVALSPDEKTAYVTNGGTNSVAVITLADKKPAVIGLIPTGWYPNSVSVSPDGSTLYVVNSKSVETPNPLNCRYISNNPGGGFGSGCQSVAAQDGSANQYAWQNEYSGFLTLPVPDVFELTRLTGLVERNNGFDFHSSRHDDETMDFLRHHIKHVIYIIKENRTFDQILGDLTNGANADPSLTQFPSFVTPNFHNFANNFVTFDNFDDSSMVSMDGWQWSTAARALDLNEKCVIVNYGKGGCNYDSEGTARNINVAREGVAARKAWQPLYPDDPNLLPGTANEVGADGPEGQEGLGYIWDAALNANLTVRNYGFYLDLGAMDVLEGLGVITPTLTNPCAANPPIQVAFPAHPDLLNNTDLCFRGFDNTLPDYFRFQEWNREFTQQVANNTFPNLTLLRLMHDHFGNFGTASFGVNTPELQIADNDYAVGLVAQTIAHSPYANNTLIFVIEDDPQDGADHVSGDRSTAFIVGPYVKQGAVVSNFYTTVSMVRTIEDVLGTSHLSIHDSSVSPMADAFDIDQNCAPKQGGGATCWTYSATPAQVLYNTTLPLPNAANVNRATLPKTTHNAAWWAAKTKGMDFRKEDLNDPGAFNRIIWEGMMGGKPYPTTRSGDVLGHSGTSQPDTEPVAANTSGESK